MGCKVRRPHTIVHIIMHAFSFCSNLIIMAQHARKTETQLQTAGSYMITPPHSPLPLLTLSNI